MPRETIEVSFRPKGRNPSERSEKHSHWYGDLSLAEPFIELLSPDVGCE
jgi:hypothetical protein